MTPPVEVAARRPLRDPSPDAQRQIRTGFRAAAGAAGAEPAGSPLERAVPQGSPPLSVVEADRRTRDLGRLRRRVIAAVMVASVLATPFALVMVHVQLTAGQLRLTNLQSRGDLAQEQYEKLRLQVSQLESPARIVASAQQLGMVTPTTIVYLPASPGSPQANPPAASGASGVQGWATAKHVDRGR